MSDNGSMFTASSVKLTKLLEDAAEGHLQLPDFQRSWVWDEERIRSLLASISRGFPVGAVMTLGTGGAVSFKPRVLEGAPPTVDPPSSLLLDGQQRLTSLYQVLVRGKAIRTVTPRKQRVTRWFYIDIPTALDPKRDRDEAIVIVPESKKITSNFGKTTELDLSSQEYEIENMMFPASELLAWNTWQTAFIQKHTGKEDFAERFAELTRFHDQVVQSFIGYLVPVIALDKATSKEAVCTVFEKVNTGGKALDAFELITAMYAAEGYELRKDWIGADNRPGRQNRLENMFKMPSSPRGVLAGVSNTDFFQAVSLFHTQDLRKSAESQGASGKDLPQVSVTRSTLLNLPLAAYLKYEKLVEDGFTRAAKFLVNHRIYRVADLPYQSQVVPLAAILADLGDDFENPSIAKKVSEWYWCGVFGELYGSTTESRIARDFLQVLAWARGGPEPTTVHDATVRADRLLSMRTRQSAAYKGVNALLMDIGAQDFRKGQDFSNTIFFEENVDIHHIFPKAWCKKQGIAPTRYDSILNKSPLSARTNRKIGGDAPSAYLSRLLAEVTPQDEQQRERLRARLSSHALDPDLLWADDFEGFMEDRQRRLAKLIEKATGKSVIYPNTNLPSEEFVVEDDE
ncbi:DUF262 domain-containing protein [Williamsia muralis]|uniref:GmrSD restriction endonuclease domain-containing protein n=1 Tax=Williamsia marianensis TaxID=85044 RepID=UPI003F14798F